MVVPEEAGSRGRLCRDGFVRRSHFVALGFVLFADRLDASTVMSPGPGPLAPALSSSGTSEMALEELLLVFAGVIRGVWPREGAVVGDIS